MAKAESDTALSLDGRLWCFAAAVYAWDGVAEACLTLQDSHGVDVVMLLFAGWIGADRRLACAEADLAQAAASTQGWREEVILPLRHLRRRLKEGPPPAPGPTTEGLRDIVSQAELRAERLQLAVLERLADAWPIGRSDPALAVVGNLDLCFHQSTGHDPTGEDARRIALIAHACVAEARS